MPVFSSRMIRVSGWILTSALVGFVFLAPMPFGGVVGWARSALVISIFLLLAVSVWIVPHPGRLRRLLPAISGLLIVVLIGLLQSMAWPVGIGERVAPEQVRLAEQAEEVSHSGIGDTATAVPLSLAPDASRRTAMLWLAVLAAGCVGALVGSERGPRVAILGAVVFSALFQVLYGLPRWMARTRSIWGVAVPGEPKRLRGTYVNPDHMALLLEIALAITLAWLWMGIRRARRAESWERRILWVVPPAVLFLTLFVALTFTGSRGGLLAAILAVVAQGLMVAASRRRWKTAPLILLAVVAGVAVAGWLGFQQAFGRLLVSSSADVTWSQRLAVYHASLGLWKRFPLLGTGLGTFRDVFPMVSTPELAGVTWTHAHSDVLELLVTVGPIGLLAVLLGVGWVAWKLYRILRDRVRTIDRAAALAALGVVAGAGLHECFDFGLTMPANALILGLVLGAAMGPLLRHEPDRSRL